MVNAHETEVILSKFFHDCFEYWKRTGSDERESFRRALEYDLVEAFNFNGGCLHDMFTPHGEELDRKTCIGFMRYRCMDMYGNDWKSHFDGYSLKQ